MTKELLRSGDLLLLFRPPGKCDFDLAPVWCEYYVPSEFDDILVGSDWIEKNLFARISKSNCSAWYTVTGDIDYSTREFLCVHCQLTLDKLNLDGYLYLSAGELTSVTILLDSESVYLYGSELLGEDNSESLKNLSLIFGVDVTSVDSISYNVVNNPVKGLVSSGSFHFCIT